MEKPRRCVVIYGHFYQPPRENPWIEAIEKQPSAEPFHDWNERVAGECYIPNQAARVVGSGGILDIVNNYAYLGFNFGPTLLSWYEQAHPRAYGPLLAADRESLARLGHGNAQAQAYNHMILPLAAPRDRDTQIRWGLADFKKRFGREPESLWLPETAVSADTLRALIDHGLKYVVLAPTQALKTRHAGRGGRWMDVSDGSIDTRRPYSWHDRDEHGRHLAHRHIQIFFYDGALAKSVAFEHAMRDSRAFADRIEAAFDPKRAEPQLVHVATDGETYGHHDPYGEMGLAHLLKYELARRGIEVMNHGAFLRLHMPSHEVEIKENSSWSCPHGLGRWSEDCGCASEGGLHQKYRAPLRRAYDWLRDELARFFEEQGAGVFKSPWQARDAYIDVILDRPRLDEFLDEQLIEGQSEERRLRAVKLLEMQRHALLMYTSCAWFFEELSRIEPVQTLKYAARALQLAKQLGGPDLERPFLEKLKEAPSNLAEYGDGWGVFEKLVRPAVATPDSLAAQYAMSLLYGDLGEEHAIHHYRIRRADGTRSRSDGSAAVTGEIEIRSGVTMESWRRRYLALALKGKAPLAWVGPAEGEFSPLRERVRGWTAADFEQTPERLRGEYFSGSPFTLETLFADERDRLYSLIIRDKLAKLDSTYDELFRDYFPVVEELASLKLGIPARVRQEVELALGHWLAHQAAQLAQGRPTAKVQETRDLLRRARRCGLKVETGESERAWSALVRRLIEELHHRPDEALLDYVRALADLGLEAGYQEWRHRTETQVFQLLREKVYAEPSRRGEPLHEGLLKLGAALGLDVEAQARAFSRQGPG